MQLSLHIGIILTLGNQILNQNDLKPLRLYALDDRRQSGRSIFCAVVHQYDRAVADLIEHGLAHLLGGRVLPIQAVDVCQKSKFISVKQCVLKNYLIFLIPLWEILKFILRHVILDL